MDSRSVLRIAGALALALLLVPPVAAADPGRIAFVSDRDGNTEIYVMDADGSDPVRLTNGGATDAYGPAWSPDGARSRTRTAPGAPCAPRRSGRYTRTARASRPSGPS